MPNESKLAVVLGVALTIAVATIFFQKEPPIASVNSTKAAEGKAVANSPSAAAMLPSPSTRMNSREIPAKITSRTDEPTDTMD